jgi:hypothetical protein
MKKSDLHFKIAALLCEYIIDEQYQDKHSALKLKIREITTEITERIDEIGAPVPVGYVRPTIIDADTPLYATRLALKMIELVDIANKQESLKKWVWKDSDFTLLKTPGRINTGQENRVDH